MSEVTIYHNPRCRKSRETLQLLRNRGIEPRVVHYLDDVPDAQQLKLILAKLDLKAHQLVRTEETLYREKFRSLQLNDDEWVAIMRENPKLIQRPIVINGAKAALGRPPENVLHIL
jgi:arsenate reductase